MSQTSIAATNMGQQRKNNEDHLYTNDTEGIYIVCDGMGGHACGEVASKMAVDFLVKGLTEGEQNWKKWLREGSNKEELKQEILALVKGADRAIIGHAQSHPETKGMGTTLTMLLVQEGKGLMVQVGDSRLYLLRKERAFQLSIDHTLAQEMVARGILTPEEGKNHIHGNVLLRALGIEGADEADLVFLDILMNDQFLLCSDGLSNYFNDNDEIIRLRDNSSEEGFAQTLIDFANQSGGSDNITVVVVRPLVPEQDTQDTIRDLKTPMWFTLDLLQSSFLCKRLKLNRVMRLHHVSKLEHFTAGSKIIEQGQIPTGLYFVMSGRCREIPIGLPERELTVGDSFCIEALTSELPSMDTIEVLEDALVLEIRRDYFMMLVRRFPRLGARLSINISQEQTRRWHAYRGQ